MNTAVSPEVPEVEGEVVFLRDTPLSEFFFSESVGAQEIFFWPLRLPAGMLSAMRLYGAAPMSFRNILRSLRMVAGLRFVYPQIERPDFFDHMAEEEIREGLTEIFRDQAQALLDARFGTGRLEVEVGRYGISSLEIFVVVFTGVSTGAGFAYTFVKDYPKLREGMRLLVDDIKKLGDFFRRRFRSKKEFKAKESPGAALLVTAA